MGQRIRDPGVPDRVRVDAVLAPNPRIGSGRVGGEVEQDRPAARGRPSERIVEGLDAGRDPARHRHDRSEIELLDVSGRRVLAREVGSLGGGRHAVNLAEGRRVAPGLYWVRLTQGANQRTTRVAITQ
jgi:hypothetical protein